MKPTTRIMLIMWSMMALLSVRAQSPGFEWATQSGGDYEIYPFSVSADPAGNTITTGYYSGTADFDPGPGTFYLTSNGGWDVFIQKLDTGGNLAWAAGMGDYTLDIAWDGNTDAVGNIYVVGHFRGTIDADPGPGQHWLYAPDRPAGFILKIAPDGNLIWARQFGDGITGFSSPNAITIDGNYNVITVGRFTEKIDFDPGAGTFYLTSTVEGINDVFVQKMDTDGNFLWVRQIKGRMNHHARAVITDAAGGIYYAGQFWGTVDFDPTVKGKYNLTAPGPWMNSYISKLTADGDFVWARMITSAESQNTGFALVLDPWGDLYVGGDFYGSPDFDPGSGVYNMTADGCDAYILKLTSTGGFIWARQLGDGLGDFKTDATGNFYLSGRFSNTSDLDPGAGTYLLTSYGSDEVFVLKCNPAGDLLWVTQTGGTGPDQGTGLDVGADGYIYATGVFSDVVDFDPDGNGIFEMSSTEWPDLFVQKLNPAGGSDCPVPDGLAVPAVGETTATLAWNAVTGATGYYVGYRDLLTNDWIVSGPVEGTSLVLNDLVATTAYEFRVRTDCMSNYSYAMGFFTQGGCPDIYEPNETAGEAAPMAVNSTIYATIGSPTDQDWLSFSTTNTAKNIKLILTGLIANYDLTLCKPDGSYIKGSNNPGTSDEIIIYNPKKGGSYTIHVYGSQGVYDPVNCYTLILEVSSTQYKLAEADISAEEAVNSLVLYPNPASEVMEVSFAQASAGNAEMALFNTSGQALLKESSRVNEGENHFTMDVSLLPDGLYLFRLVADNEIVTRKVVIRH